MAASSNKMIQGVCISCNADIDLRGAKKYYAVEVAENDAVFNDFVIQGDILPDEDLIPSCPVSPISELIGMPVHVRKIPPHASWKDDTTCGRYVNVEATLLCMAVKPSSDFWGLAPKFWQNRVGSVLITRVDGNDIAPQEVEVLCAYTRWFVEEPMQDAKEGAGSYGDKKRVAEYKKTVETVTPEAFHTFYEGFKTKKGAKDPSWAAVQDPVVMTSSGNAAQTSGYEIRK